LEALFFLAVFIKRLSVKALIKKALNKEVRMLVSVVVNITIQDHYSC